MPKTDSIELRLLWTLGAPIPTLGTGFWHLLEAKLNRAPTNFRHMDYLSFRSKSLVALLAISLSFIAPIKANAAAPTIIIETPVTAAIKGVGDVWTGKVPTKVAFTQNEFCDVLSFSIQALNPAARRLSSYPNSLRRNYGYRCLYRLHSANWINSKSKDLFALTFGRFVQNQHR